jgi:hypothetical protein
VGYLTEGMHQPSLIRREDGKKVAQWMLSGMICVLSSNYKTFQCNLCNISIVTDVLIVGGVPEGNYTTMVSSHSTHQSQITAHRTHAYTTGPSYTTTNGETSGNYQLQCHDNIGTCYLINQLRMIINHQIYRLSPTKPR